MNDYPEQTGFDLKGGTFRRRVYPRNNMRQLALPLETNPCHASNCQREACDNCPVPQGLSWPEIEIERTTKRND